jgi:hypothetical protein
MSLEHALSGYGTAVDTVSSIQIKLFLIYARTRIT